MKELYICHAGAGLEKGKQEEMGIIGMVYLWEGEWIRSPEEVEGRDAEAIMKLRPVFSPEVEVWGDLSCFTPIKYLSEQLNAPAP